MDGHRNPDIIAALMRKAIADAKLRKPRVHADAEPNGAAVVVRRADPDVSNFRQIVTAVIDASVIIAASLGSSLHSCLIVCPPLIDTDRYVPSLARSALARWSHLAPWELTIDAAAIVRTLLAELPKDDFIIAGEIAVHRSTVVETGAVLKAPLILGAGCYVAFGAYLRGGNWVAENCTFGPATELKSSFVLSGTKLAHFNFVGDSVLGSDVNLEAGSVICNYRNERSAKEIQVRVGSHLQGIGTEKFGALVGDHSRIGANAVLAPGAILLPGTVIRRTQLCDQEITGS